MSEPMKYHIEVIRLNTKCVDHVSRHIHSQTIPIPWDLGMEDILAVRDVLNDTSWEVMNADVDYVYFKRYIEGSYPK